MFRLRHLLQNRRLRVFLPALIAAIIWATLPAHSARLMGVMARDSRLYAGLSGAPINGVTPGGVAEYRVQVGNIRSLEVYAVSVNLPVGTMLNVLVDNSLAGQMTVTQFSNGTLRLETNNGQTVPMIDSGSTIAINQVGGGTILSGSFSSTPVPSPSGSPTGSPTASPSPTGSPTASPSPTGSPTASPSPTGSPTASPSPTGSPTASPSPSPVVQRFFATRLRGNQEVPPVNTNGRGVGLVRLNGGENQITVSLGFFRLSSAQTAANINGPAAAGANGPVIFDLGVVGGTNGLINATFPVTPVQVQQLRAGLLYLNVHSANFPNGEIRGQLRLGHRSNDFDSDGRSDISVFRVSDGNWYTNCSGSGQIISGQLGIAGDITAPGDYDSDGATDLGVFRPSTGNFLVRATSTGAVTNFQWGANGDIPVVGDYDGDGRDDLAVFRPSTGAWYVLRSSDGTWVGQAWGISGDKPITGDFDGDGRNDFAVFRPSNGGWYVLRSSDNTWVGQAWGIAEDRPVSGDFDGDGMNDFAVYRPSNGTWYIMRSTDNGLTYRQFGVSEDIPVAGNFDDDSRTDMAVYRPSTQMWYMMHSGDDSFHSEHFGSGGDDPPGHH